ncbi:MAG: hypothetical protein OHK0046_22520 [Anaerolineae bacterium]
MQFTRFDFTVFSVVVALAATIGLTLLFFEPNEPAPQVAYLKLSESGFYEVWIASTDNPDGARQITETPYGVNDFDVSGDGRYIVYAERDFETGVSDLKLIDLQTDTISQLTNCVLQDADCSTPRFRPDGRMIAYERLERNTALGTGIGSSRVWLLDLSSNPPTTYPMFDDAQFIGYGAEWSADGTHLALYDSANLGILVRDMTATEENTGLYFVPTSYGVVGSLSPDGVQMVYPDLLIDGTQSRGRIQLVELQTGLTQDLTPPGEGADDQQTAWSPDGRYIAIGRRYNDERYTRGAQVYLYDTTDDSIAPLIFDERYSNGLFTWSPDSTALALQRAQLLNDDGSVSTRNTTEVWTYNLETRQLTFIDDDAIRPLWIP